jgi:hypothetical protein
MSDKMPLDHLVKIFKDNDWKPFYESLTTWMTTIGPQPPPEWLDEGIKV